MKIFKAIIFIILLIIATILVMLLLPISILMKRMDIL